MAIDRSIPITVGLKFSHINGVIYTVTKIDDGHVTIVSNNNNRQYMSVDDIYTLIYAMLIEPSKPFQFSRIRNLMNE